MLLPKGKNCRASRGQDGVGGTVEHKRGEREARWKLPSIFPGLSLTIRILLRGRERVVAS